jgi:hypoxanthine-guanine phosphoribosyltransferase
MREAGPVAIEAAAVLDRVGAIAGMINRRHGSEVTLVALLTEGAPFARDLADRLPGSTVAGIRVSAFGTTSRARAERVGDIPTDRPAIIAAAVVDTGLRLRVALRELGFSVPAAEACTLLDRPARRLVGDLPLVARGFVVPDCLFAGYGLGGPTRSALPDIHYDDAASALTARRTQVAVAS